MTMYRCPRCGWRGLEMSTRLTVHGGRHCPQCYKNGAGVRPVEAI